MAPGDLSAGDLSARDGGRDLATEWADLIQGAARAHYRWHGGAVPDGFGTLAVFEYDPNVEIRSTERGYEVWAVERGSDHHDPLLIADGLDVVEQYLSMTFCDEQRSGALSPIPHLATEDLDGVTIDGRRIQSTRDAMTITWQQDGRERSATLHGWYVGQFAVALQFSAADIRRSYTAVSGHPLGKAIRAERRRLGLPAPEQPVKQSAWRSLVQRLTRGR